MQQPTSDSVRSYKMKPTYTEVTTPSGNEIIIATYPDGRQLSFMKDPANSDYQAYLKRDEPQVEHLTEIPTPDEA